MLTNTQVERADVPRWRCALLVMIIVSLSCAQSAAAWKVWRERRETAVGIEAGSEGAALANAATDSRMTLQRFQRTEV